MSKKSRGSYSRWLRQSKKPHGIAACMERKLSAPAQSTPQTRTPFLVNSGQGSVMKWDGPGAKWIPTKS